MSNIQSTMQMHSLFSNKKRTCLFNSFGKLVFAVYLHFFFLRLIIPKVNKVLNYVALLLPNSTIQLRILSFFFLYFRIFFLKAPSIKKGMLKHLSPSPSLSLSHTHTHTDTHTHTHTLLSAWAHRLTIFLSQNQPFLCNTILFLSHSHSPSLTFTFSGFFSLFSSV